ncbi:MAG: CotH kinase family protein [Crocinitomicaceae bacterium]
MKIFLFAFALFLVGTSISQVEFTSSNLPILIVETNGQEIVDDPKITATLKVINQTEERNYLSTQEYTFEGLIGIEFRGNTSQSFPKKSYGFELRDSVGENVNFPLLGLPKENDWILYAPYTDKSLLRNVLAFDMARKMGHYASRTVFCELVINSEYQGLYVLMEKIKRDKNRVDISKLNEDENSGIDLTGGYIIKIDNPTGTFCSAWEPPAANFHIQFEYPDCDEITQEQEDYIKDYVIQFQDALSLQESNNADRSYVQFADESSIIDYFLINEFSKNIDAYMLSSFLYKDKNEKLVFGPIWDYNLSFGNASLREGYLTSGWQSDINEVPWWWNVMLADPVIKSKIEERWCELRSIEFSNKSILNQIDAYSELVGEAQERNFKKWPILGETIWPNYYVGSTFEEEINYLSVWINARLAWMDKKLNCSVSENNSIEVFPNPVSSELNCAIYLTHETSIWMNLYDYHGKKVSSFIENVTYPEGYWQFEWQVSHLQAGKYLLKIQIGSSEIQTVKVLKL